MAGLVALAAFAGGAIWVGKLLTTVVGKSTDPLGALTQLYSDPKKFFPGQDKATILLVGKDYSYDSKFQRYTGKSSRADSIMLLSLDFKTRKVSALSIPRDTRVRIDGKIGKINGTFSAETYPGKGGPALIEGAVESLTGVHPDYYLALKPDAVGNLVEELGGVEVELLDNIEYNDFKAGLHGKLAKGKQFLTKGEDAVIFARYREVDAYVRNPDGSGVYVGKTSSGIPIFKRKPREELTRLNKCEENGDTRRMVRQQLLIRAMMTSGKQLKNLLRAPQIIETGFKQFDTDMKREQLVALAMLFRDIKPDQVASGTLAGDFENHKPFHFIPDRRKNEALVKWLIDGDEEAANRVTTVAVQNGTTISGAARRVADLLKEKAGFDASFSAEAPKQPVAETVIWFTKATNKPRADRIAQLLGGGKVQKDMGPDTTGSLKVQRPDIRVVLGPDIAKKLSSQSAQG